MLAAGRVVYAQRMTGGWNEQKYNAAIAGEVRAAAARERVSGTRLALGLGLTKMAVSRRMHGHTPWGAAELAAVADLLGVTVAELYPPLPRPRTEKLPHLDSNQEPADYQTAVLTLVPAAVAA